MKCEKCGKELPPDGLYTTCVGCPSSKFQIGEVVTGEAFKAMQNCPTEAELIRQTNQPYNAITDILFNGRFHGEAIRPLKSLSDFHIPPKEPFHL